MLITFNIVVVPIVICSAIGLLDAIQTKSTCGCIRWGTLLAVTTTSIKLS